MLQQKWVFAVPLYTKTKTFFSTSLYWKAVNENSDLLQVYQPISEQVNSEQIYRLSKTSPISTNFPQQTRPDRKAPKTFLGH